MLTSIRIISEMLPPQYYTDVSNQDLTAIHREILLSYRVIFGRTSRSRDLFSKFLEQESESTDRSLDPFLVTLCTTPLSYRVLFSRRRNPKIPSRLFPPSSLDKANELMESGVYSARDDFPTFGPRLSSLQQYNLRQQPSRARDLWRDRRNPLQWYTFWAVVWVGGTAIIIGIVQIVLAAGQLYFAVHPPK